MIRSAVAADADAVFGLLRQLAVSTVPDQAVFSGLFPGLVVDSSTILLVAADDESSVRGYALASLSTLLYTNGVSAQLQELVVDSSARSRGLGSALLEAVEAECRRRGAHQLTVASRRASRFYADRGYDVTADFLKRAL